MLYGRDAELARVGALLEDAKASRSGALIVRGEPGVGKSALLEDARERASDMHVLTARGVQSELQLPFAGLHQLVRPARHLLGRLPAPQAAALQGALGLAARAGEDRFMCVNAWSSSRAGMRWRSSSSRLRCKPVKRPGGRETRRARWSPGTEGVLELSGRRADRAATSLLGVGGARPGDGHPYFALMSAPDLAEACVLAGRQDRARDAFAVFQGFAQPGAPTAVGSGLRGLADRVEALGGLLLVTSPAGAGTVITAELPLGS